jgi:hypothetical protein|tara:strand:+ start:30 stop:191 length:162 start_codon:yes stop_codon:yes gene_type:complete
MRMWEVVTGERVRIYAEDEQEMFEKLSNSDYEWIEAETTVEFVSGPLGKQEAK